MSEYQYYRFERLDGYLDSKARQALREISSRADITATSFQVYYHYSGLKAEPYRYWLTPDTIEPYIEQAEALAKKLAIEKAEKEKALIEIYSQREHCWQQAQEQANRTCASGYDQASRYLQLPLPLLIP